MLLRLSPRLLEVGRTSNYIKRPAMSWRAGRRCAILAVVLSRRFLLGLLAGLFLSGCSLLYAPQSESQDGGGVNARDGDVANDASPDASVEDMLCTPGNCPSRTFVHSIGASAAADFANPQDWIDARHGDLVSRIVLAVERPQDGDFLVGATLVGETSGCTGTFVDDGRGETSSRVSLESPSGPVCQVGETLKSDTYEVVVVGYLSEGVIERGELRAGTYSPETAITFPRDGGITDQDHYMWLTSRTSDRHMGVAGAGAILDGSQLMAGYQLLLVDLAYTRFDWLEASRFPRTAFHITASEVFAQHMIVHSAGGSGFHVDDLNLARDPSLWLANSVFYDLEFWAVMAKGSESKATVGNVTVHGCLSAEDTPNSNGCLGARLGAVFEAYNTVAISTLAMTGGDFYAESAGVLSAASDHNASGDGSAPGSNPTTGILPAVFLDADAVIPDLRPSPTGLLSGAGAPLSWPYVVSRDLSGAERTQWNIGAF